MNEDVVRLSCKDLISLARNGNASKQRQKNNCWDFFNEDHHGYWNGKIDGKIATF